jgi:hypothetical protein
MASQTPLCALLPSMSFKLEQAGQNLGLKWQKVKKGGLLNWAQMYVDRRASESNSLRGLPDPEVLKMSPNSECALCGFLQRSLGANCDGVQGGVQDGTPSLFLI